VVQAGRVIDLEQALVRAQPALQQRILQLSLQVDQAYISKCIGTLAQLFLQRATDQSYKGGCPIIGISGAQGTGKSSVALLVYDLLVHGFDKRAVVLSLDDYYLSKAERSTLAAQVHPLLITRGVPGTHAQPELHSALKQLRVLGSGQTFALLRFDKASDDRMREKRICSGPLDLILFEGWCVGARPEPDLELVQPMNELEATEDRDGSFRRFVNTQLEGPYAALWRELDMLVYLAAPDLQAVRAFRSQQEDKLRASRPPPPAGGGGGAGAHQSSGIMNEKELQRFVQHFERVTVHMLRTAPADADAVVQLDASRNWNLNIKSV
jgi:D-glycerate 3-kinase